MVFTHKVDTASPEDVQHVVADAHAAFGSGIWSRAPAIHRSRVLMRLARALEERTGRSSGADEGRAGLHVSSMIINLLEYKKKW